MLPNTYIAMTWKSNKSSKMCSLMWKMSSWNPIFLFQQTSSLIFTFVNTCVNAAIVIIDSSSTSVKLFIFFVPISTATKFSWQRLDHLLPAIWNHCKQGRKMFFFPKLLQLILIVEFQTPVAKKILDCFSATYRQFAPPKGTNSWSQNCVVVGKLQIYKTRRPGTKSD